MSMPGNGIFVVRGEISILITAMRRGAAARWSSHSHQDDDDNLMKNLQELKDVLNKIDDLRLIQPLVYLEPFLEIIRSGDTTGPITSLALSAVGKFLSYGLMDPTLSSIPKTVHQIADAVTHARFVGTDQTSDGVVLMRILQVLRTLTLAPEGITLTNESLCEIMLSCFRICFETRLNELLRRTAEYYLKDMVHLIFMRLPQFSEDSRNVKQLIKMRPGVIEQTTRTTNKRRRSFRIKKDEQQQQQQQNLIETPDLKQSQHLATTPITPSSNIVDMQGTISRNSSNIENNNSEMNITPDCQQDNQKIDDNDDGSKENLISTTPPPLQQEQPQSNDDDDVVDDNNEDQEYVNQRGIRFAQKIPQEETILIPYGLACVRELLRFLISLCNPNDKQNTDIMIHLGLTLLTVAFEIGADNIGKHATLLMLVKDGLCRNLFSLLNSERVSVFAADLQLCFLIFESLRVHLKYQLEFYLTKLIEIIVSDTGKITYEHKEIALDNILQLWRIPGFITELYINYDCNMYCTNLYEDLTKLLAKNAFSASTTSGIYHTHMLSLNALLTVIDNIENNCNLSNKKETNRMIITRRIDVIDENNETIESIENFIETNQQQQQHQRFKLVDDIPKKDKLMACKHIKKWLPMGTEHFNHKPKKGIQFFQEHGILKPELDPYEIAIFLKENTNLDKKMIGEFISNRSNLHILDAFVKTFDFTNMRIDQALRYYLETFRLPGEAPTISLLLEHFAEHWHKSNGEPFADVDSAFTLAYAIIMLNVDQHNQNAKKQTTPMSLNGFKKNLKGVNGGGDFEEEMLDEIYHAIKNEEIVMPAEQTGIVRENYLWKVLLRKGESRDGQYYRIINNEYDPELFSLIFGPIIAALSFIFDRSDDQLIYAKAIDGFKKCAYISSSFNMIQNIDTILLTLCKFTTFHHNNNTTTTHRNLNNIINFGNNRKAQLSLKTLTEFYHLYGDNIRDGWKYLFNLLLSLYCNNLLTKTFVEVEDFIQQNGKIILNYEEPENLQKQDISLFSSLYSYMLSNDNLTKIPTVEEQQSIDLAKQIITECNLEQIITDSKFLHDDSLKELINALIELSRGPDLQEQHINLNYNYNENLVVFFLELLVKIVIQNRDRVMVIWQTVRDHLYTLVMNSSLFDYQFLLERAVIDLLRIAIRLMRNEEMSPIVLQSLRMLLLLKSTTISRISRQISYGLYELLKTSAQNIHTQTDWSIIFTLLECVGAGAQPPKPIIANNTNENHQDDDHGYTSDNELIKNNNNNNNNVSPSNGGSPSGWILVGNNENDIQPVVGRTVPPNQYNLLLERNLSTHDPYSLMKCCESLAFLVRDVAHITPYNFDDCVHCIRTFVEASLNGNKKHQRYRKLNHKKSIRKSPPTSSPDDSDNDDGGGDDDLPNGYHQIAIQLLDLMHTLHTRTAQIFKWWAEEGGTVIETQNISLWTQGWCPLLQGIARLCCDQRRDIRMSAITYLQRALLVHDLQTLNGIEWEQCFHRVLFPLLNHLLLPIEHNDCVAMEETRMRAATLLSKVFLHHLTPLLSLPTFPNLWLIILDFIDKYMHADHSDLLYEAIPESLKNMLLVMDSAGVFNNNNNNSNNTKGPLWYSTWDRINKFLPNMKDELFKEIEQIDEQQQQQQQSNKNDVIKQHNIENATKSSIILQPLATNQPVSSHLFAHLGQMVSTPIPPCTSTDTVFQSNLQPYLYTQNENTFPVLYNSPIISTTTTTTVSTITTTSESTNVPPSSQQQQQQPVPLYTEYIENPYNIKETDVNLDVNDNNDDSITQDDDNNIDNRNYFQSSTYFQIDTNNIPTGCEILYGKQQTTNNDDHDDKNSVIPQTIQTNDCTDV